MISNYIFNKFYKYSKMYDFEDEVAYACNGFLWLSMIQPYFFGLHGEPLYGDISTTACKAQFKVLWAATYLLLT